MKWITNQGTPLENLASSWLIVRFIDQKAEIIFAAKDELDQKIEETKGIPFNIEGVELSARGGKSTFDNFLFAYRFTNPALEKLSDLIRESNLARLEEALTEAKQTSLLEKLKNPSTDDKELLEQALQIYDGLYTWCKEQILSKPVVPKIAINRYL